MLANGNTITTVAHYKDAAKRHLEVCDILFTQLNSYQNDNIVAELYYLSGYIVECSINYKYLVHRGFSDSEDYNDRNRWGENVRLKGHFRFTANVPSCEKILQELSNTSANIPTYLLSLGQISTSILTNEELIKKKYARKMGSFYPLFLRKYWTYFQFYN